MFQTDDQDSEELADVMKALEALVDSALVLFGELSTYVLQSIQL